jgi:hypothetical protein
VDVRGSKRGRSGADRAKSRVTLKSEAGCCQQQRVSEVPALSSESVQRPDYRLHCRIFFSKPSSQKQRTCRRQNRLSRLSSLALPSVTKYACTGPDGRCRANRIKASHRSDGDGGRGPKRTLLPTYSVRVIFVILMPILAQSSIDDRKRLLELFPVSTLRHSFQAEGTKEEICYAAGADNAGPQIQRVVEFSLRRARRQGA